MLIETSTAAAPWHVVPANDKRHARIAALREIVRTLGAEVEVAPITPDDRVLDAAEGLLNVDDALIASLRGRTE